MKEYQKFIIISHRRFGSTLLIRLLNSHPNIVAKAEKFKNLENTTTLDVWDEVFDDQPEEIKAVGCKIFYFHPMGSEDKTVWDKIDTPEIKKIHLIRGKWITKFYFNKNSNSNK